MSNDEWFFHCEIKTIAVEMAQFPHFLIRTKAPRSVGIRDFRINTTNWLVSNVVELTIFGREISPITEETKMVLISLWYRLLLVEMSISFI